MSDVFLSVGVRAIVKVPFDAKLEVKRVGDAVKHWKAKVVSSTSHDRRHDHRARVPVVSSQAGWAALREGGPALRVLREGQVREALQPESVRK